MRTNRTKHMFIRKVHRKAWSQGLTIFIFICSPILWLSCQKAVHIALPAEGEDATPIVREAIEKMGNGGTITFEKGVYDFFPEKGVEIFLNPSNNTAGEKQVCFCLEGKKHMTIEGNGSTFVFHSGCFPFALLNSEKMELRNMKLTNKYPYVAAFQVVEKDEKGCEIEFAENACPCHADEKGHLIFEMEDGEISTCDRKLSMHALQVLNIKYIFAGETTASFESLAASFVNVFATQLSPKRFRLDNLETGKPGELSEMPFGIGESVVMNLLENRDKDVIFVNNSRGVHLKNVHIARGGGMGMIAQMSEDIRLDSCQIVPEEGEEVSVTADMLMLVNCAGTLEVANCRMGCSLDDAMNIHGNYTIVEEFHENQLELKVGHQDHRYFFPYRIGDSLEIVEQHNRKVLAKTRVESLPKISEDGWTAHLVVSKIEGKMQEGSLVENITTYPDVYIHDCEFFQFPHTRLSGRGYYRIEGNRYEHCAAALLSFDLADFWYEAGRLSEMEILNNTFVDCNAMSGANAFLQFGISGWGANDPNTPKIHDKVYLKGNKYEGLNGNKYSVCGVQNFHDED